MDLYLNIGLIVVVLALLFLTTRRLVGWYVYKEESIAAAVSLAMSRRLLLLWLVFFGLNILTTVAALIPIGFAVYNLVTNNQHQALNSSLLGLATVVVTKGGLLVLSLFLKPAIVGASGYVGQRVAKKVWQSWIAQEKKKPPTT